MHNFFTKIKKYLRVYGAFFHFSLLQAIEFRFNLLLRIVLSLAWLGITLFTVQVVFNNVNTVAGWTRDEVFLLILTIRLLKDVLFTLFMEGLGNMSEYIRQGQFDFMLLKPINTRFLISFFPFNVRDLPRIGISIYLFTYFARNIGPFSLIHWIQFLFLCFLGVLIFYSMYFGMQSLNFWFIRLWNLSDLFDQFMGMGKMPVYAYRGLWQLVFIYIVPVAFVSTFPLEFLFGRGTPLKMLLAIILTIVFYYLGKLIYKKGAADYSSASS